MKKLVLIGICALLYSSCKKREYPPDIIQNQKEEIFLSGYFGNEQVSLKVGSDDYYCYSSFSQGTDSIYRFKGELKKYNCEICAPSVLVELSDYKQRMPGASIDADVVFELGQRAFVSEVNKINTLKFSGSSNKEISSIRWDVSNGNSSVDSVLEVDFAQIGIQTVSLTIITVGNCKSTVLSKIYVGGENGILACNVLSSVTSNSIASFSSTIIGGKAPFKYSWMFGDGTFSSEVLPIHHYQFAGSYPVKLIIEDAEQNKCEANYIFITGNDNSSCNATILLSSLGSRSLIYNGVKLQWKDKSNIIFKSDSVAQTSESYFEIIDSKEFKKNEKGEAGRLLTLRFNVLVSDGTRKVWFKSDNSAIAVTYK